MKRLEVVIVGAGIGGLATSLALAQDGHMITILDAITEFSEVGAGIRVPPNSSRLLRQWGVPLDGVQKVISRGNRFADWKGNHLLDVPYGDGEFESKFDAPYYLIHRADLVDALLQAVKAHPNITVMTNCKVVDYDFSRPAVKTAQGNWYPADLVVSAEGIKSSIREDINGEPICSQDTGDVAYRIIVSAEEILNDPHTRHLVTEPWATHWMGPEGHAVGYPLRGRELYNIIVDVTHRSDMGRPVGMDEWRRQADNKELTDRFGEWCYPVRKLCGLTGEYLKWKLVDLDKPLTRWVHPAGKVVLLGDAAHPMMPYMAQGAAQAIEDAAVLRAALIKTFARNGDDDDNHSFNSTDQDDLSAALALYQTHRARRAEYIVQNTRVLQDWLHLYDGPARDARDEAMKHDDPSNPIFWGYTPRLEWLFGYNAEDLDDPRAFDIPELPPLPPPDASVYSSTAAI